MVREGDLGRECRIECRKTKRCLISEGIGWGVSRFSLRCAYDFLFGRFRALAKQATHWCKDSSLPFAEGIQCVLASMVIWFRANLSLHVARSSSCLRTNRRWILDCVVEGMSSTSSSQSPTLPGRESTSANDNARPHDPGTDSAGPARSRLSLQLDQRSLHFSVNAWVLIVALIGILPVASRQLQYKGYRLSLLGTTCTTGYALFAFYGLPRAGSTQAVQVWCHHVTSSKDFIPFMYCLMFVTSKLHLKLVLVPVICWALEHVSRFLRRHFTNSSLYRAYLEQLCTWVETNITAVNFLTANAEILLGFLLILSLFSRQRNVMQTFMYWQLLKLMYHSPYTAGYHRAIWLKIGRTVNPYIHRYTPFLHDPINAGMRWWFR